MKYSSEKLENKLRRKALYLENMRNKEFEDFRNSIFKISKTIDSFFYGHQKSDFSEKRKKERTGATN